MTDSSARVRLHDVHIHGDGGDHDGVLEAIQRAIARTVVGEETQSDSRIVRAAIATEVRGDQT